MTHLVLWFGLQPASAGPGIDFWDLVMRASWVSKLVLLILLVFSVVTWAIIFARWFLWRRIDRADDQFVEMFHRSRDAKAIARETRRVPDSGLAQIYHELYRHHQTWQQAVRVGTMSWRESMHAALERAINETLDPLERRLGFLATTAGVAPFIGLFGTVLGIIAAFESIGRLRTADLSVVAPGIAEALVATAMGLFAAIPAVIAYNRYAADTDRLVNLYENFLEEFSTLLQRQAHLRAGAGSAAA